MRDTDPTTITVATWNVHLGEARRGAPLDLLRVGAELDADVLALQEAWSPRYGYDLAPALADAMGYTLHETAAVARRGSPDPFRVSLLCRLDHVRGDDIPIGAGGTALPRAVLPITVRVDGVAIGIAAVHLADRRDANARHLMRLRRWWRTPPRDDHAILLGDFNCWGRPVTLALPGLARAVVGRTFPARRPLAQVDHILVTEGLRVVRGEVVTGTGSDHHAVVAGIQVPGEGDRTLRVAR